MFNNHATPQTGPKIQGTGPGPVSGYCIDFLRLEYNHTEELPINIWNIKLISII